MTAALTRTDATSAALAIPEAELRRALDLSRASVAPATLRAYERAHRDFSGYCAERGLSALPAEPETVAAYLAALADRGRAVSTIRQTAAAIRWLHDWHGHASPTATKVVRSIVSGIAREVGSAPKAQKAALTADRLRVVLSHVRGDDPKSVRDRALLLVGFAGAFRRSELVALDVADLEERDSGLLVRIRRSKADQEGRGQEVAILTGDDPATCPVRALRAWLDLAGIAEGRVFRSVTKGGRIGEGLSPRTVANVVKAATARAGIEGDFSGHSLRAGLVTSAAMGGRRAETIAAHTRHKSLAMVQRYTRREDLFRGHAAEGLL